MKDLFVGGADYLSDPAKLAAVSGALALVPGPQQALFVAVSIVAGAVASEQAAANHKYAEALLDAAGAGIGTEGVLIRVRAIFLEAKARQITSATLLSASDQQALLRLISSRRGYILKSEALFSASTLDNVAASLTSLFVAYPNSSAPPGSVDRYARRVTNRVLGSVLADD